MKTEDTCYGHSATYGVARLFAIALCIVFLAPACASTQRTQWKLDAAQPLTCSKGPDCEAKWGRALTWVRNNAKSTVKTANETIISTEFPVEHSFAFFSITKTDARAGTYAINFRAACVAILGCEPEILELKASFANYVMRSTDSATTDELQVPTARKGKEALGPKADLGIVTVKTSETAANKLGMKEPKGTRIIHIGSDSAAFDFGLHLDDVILTFAGQTIDGAEDLDTALQKTTPPKAVPITIWRAGAGEMVITVRF